MDALAIRGDEGRGKTAISLGERQARFDPGISEWGNPAIGNYSYSRLSKVGLVERTQGTETSKYLKEK